MSATNPGKFLATEYIRAICESDIEIARPVVHENFVHELMGTSYAGDFSLKEIFAVIEKLNSVVEKIQINIVVQVVDGDTVVTRARGEMKTIRNEPYCNDYVFWAEIRDGKLQRVREYCDTQLGQEKIVALY